MSEYEEFQTPAWPIGKTLPPLSPASTHSTGVDLISQERSRQVSEEGWSPEHDDSHRTEELAQAAACYATPAHHRRRLMSKVPILWPWCKGWWKPMAGEWTAHRRIIELVKAGALVAAEIDRLLRAQSAALTFPPSTKPPASELPATADSPSGPTDNDSKEEVQAWADHEGLLQCRALLGVKDGENLYDAIKAVRARLQKQEEQLKEHREARRIYWDAIDAIYNSGETGLELVKTHFGLWHPPYHRKDEDALSQTPALVHSETEGKTEN